MSGISYGDARLCKLYSQEREKGSYLPDADSDFIAFESALKIRIIEKQASGEVPYFSGPIY